MDCRKKIHPKICWVGLKALLNYWILKLEILIIAEYYKSNFKNLSTYQNLEPCLECTY